MIEGIFIIHESGICLVSRSYNRKNKDKDLIGGFLLAVSCFARKMIGEEINEIKMEHTNIIYNLKDSILLAVVLSGKRIAKRKLTNILNKIQNTFHLHYKEYLAQNIIEPEVFKAFGKVVDDILKSARVLTSSIEIETSIPLSTK
ncbi:MAG: hypothetical protein ACFFAJ_04045 [Candidatus Hodarchaeota archaeon]